MNWGSCSPQLLPTITCSARLWVNQVRRLVSGWEALRAQGFPVHRLDFDQLTQRQFMELVGNAFSGFVVAPIVTAIIMHAPWADVPVPVPSRLPRADCTAQGDDFEHIDSDEDDDSASSMTTLHLSRP